MGSLRLTSDLTITLEFPADDTNPWALIKATGASVGCEATNWDDASKADTSVTDGLLTLQLKYTGQADLKPGDLIDITITLSSSVPNGTAWVTVSYSGFEHLADTVRLPVLKTPLVISTGKDNASSLGVGIGTTNPGQYRLQVAGGPVQLDGTLTVSGTSTFQDNVTINPGKSLKVGGMIRSVLWPGATLAGMEMIDGSTVTRGVIGVAYGPGNFSNDAVAGDVIVRADTGKLLLQSGDGSSAIAISTGNNVGVGTPDPGGGAAGDWRAGPTGWKPDCQRSITLRIMSRSAQVENSFFPITGNRSFDNRHRNLLTVGQ